MGDFPHLWSTAYFFAKRSDKVIAQQVDRYTDKEHRNSSLINCTSMTWFPSGPLVHFSRYNFSVWKLFEARASHLIWLAYNLKEFWGTVFGSIFEWSVTGGPVSGALVGRLRTRTTKPFQVFFVLKYIPSFSRIEWSVSRWNLKIKSVLSEKQITSIVSGNPECTMIQAPPQNGNLGGRDL